MIMQITGVGSKDAAYLLEQALPILSLFGAPVNFLNYYNVPNVHVVDGAAQPVSEANTCTFGFPGFKPVHGSLQDVANELAKTLRVRCYVIGTYIIGYPSDASTAAS